MAASGYEAEVAIHPWFIANLANSNASERPRAEVERILLVLASILRL